MRAELLISWAATVAVVYAILLAAYVVIWLNRGIAGAKIQARQTSPAQIRRDQRQSVVSLAAIAAMFGTGHWLYAEFGWGLAPIDSIGGGVIAFIGSLVLFDTWFYWFHRLIHADALPRVHRWHHLTVTPVAWSNNSDRLVDNLFLQSYWLWRISWCRRRRRYFGAQALRPDHRGYRALWLRAWRRWCRPSPLVRHSSRSAPPVFPAPCDPLTLWDRLMGPAP
jgi:sterol desaturase/sphingolipid hydroxylase (fatty acid hydroxylase superfamily)